MAEPRRTLIPASPQVRAGRRGLSIGRLAAWAWRWQAMLQPRRGAEAGSIDRLQDEILPALAYRHGLGGRGCRWIGRPWP